MFHHQTFGQSQGWAEDQERYNQHAKESFVLHQQPSTFLVPFDPGPLGTTVHAGSNSNELLGSSDHGYDHAIIDCDWMANLGFLANGQAIDPSLQAATYFAPVPVEEQSLSPYYDGRPSFQYVDWLNNTGYEDLIASTANVMSSVPQDFRSNANPSIDSRQHETVPTKAIMGSAGNKSDQPAPKRLKLQPRIPNPAVHHNLCPLSSRDTVRLTQHRELVPGRRKIIRKVGRACILCSEDKVKCDATESPQPCHACLKRAFFSRTIASRLCWRYNLKVWEVRKTVENFRQTSRNESNFITNDLPVNGRRQIVLCNMPVTSRAGLRFSEHRLLVEVEEIACSGAATDGSNAREGDSHKLNTMIQALKTSPRSAADATLLGYLDDSFQTIQVQEPSSLYRISEDHLKLIRDSIMKWSLNDLSFRSRYPPQTDQDALDFFLLAYATHDPPLPMADLIKNTISAMAVCRHMVHESFVEILESENTGSQDGNAIAFASLPKPARTQIFAIGLEKFQQIEALILHEIDRVDLRRLDGGGTRSCSDPLILGLCIRRIALWYRNLMFRYKNYGESVVDRYRKGQKLYDLMTWHYCHVFRGTLSPFDEDWEQEKHAAALGNDAELVQAFDVFKVVEKKQCQRLHREDDGVYLSLFVNRKNRKGKSMGKLAGLA